MGHSLSKGTKAVEIFNFFNFAEFIVEVHHNMRQKFFLVFSTGFTEKLLLFCKDSMAHFVCFKTMKTMTVFPLFVSSNLLYYKPSTQRTTASLPGTSPAQNACSLAKAAPTALMR